MLTWTPFCRHWNLAVSVCELNATLHIMQGAQLCWQHIDISHLLRVLGVSCPTSSSCSKREGACMPASPIRPVWIPQIPTASQKKTPTLLFRQLNSALYVFQEQTHYSRMHCWTQCRNTWVNFYGVCIQVLRLKDQMVFLAIKFLNSPYLTYRMFALLSSLV